MAEHRDDPEIFWVDPKRRGVFPLETFHISRSLARRLRRDDYRVSLNEAFDHVIDACADRPETWINPEIRDVFLRLHALKHAQSLEVWNAENKLIGGVYGLCLGGAFFGESMFSRETNASKIALAWLVHHLRACGFILFDTQFLTEHLASLGAVEITRGQYRLRLEQALDVDADFFAKPLPVSGQDVVHRKTQTS